MISYRPLEPLNEPLMAYDLLIAIPEEDQENISSPKSPNSKTLRNDTYDCIKLLRSAHRNERWQNHFKMWRLSLLMMLITFPSTAYFAWRYVTKSIQQEVHINDYKRLFILDTEETCHDKYPLDGNGTVTATCNDNNYIDMLPFCEILFAQICAAERNNPELVAFILFFIMAMATLSKICRRGVFPIADVSYTLLGSSAINEKNSQKVLSVVKDLGKVITDETIDQTLVLLPKLYTKHYLRLLFHKVFEKRNVNSEGIEDIIYGFSGIASSRNRN